MHENPCLIPILKNCNSGTALEQSGGKLLGWMECGLVLNRIQLKYQISLTRLAGFGLLGLISDSHIYFQKSRDELRDHKGQENVNCTIVVYEHTFYGQGNNPSCSEDDKFYI